MSLHQSLQILYPTALYDTLPHTVLSYHHIVWRDETIPKPTEQTLLDFQAQLNAAATDPTKLLRILRNKHLAKSDVRVLPDFPQSEDTRQAWLAYRQVLRDLPTAFPNPAADARTGKLHLVDWPLDPNGNG